MKFGKQLVKSQVPEWSRNYLSYKLLKQRVKDAQQIQMEYGYNHTSTENAITGT